MTIVSWLGAKAVIASGNNPALGLTTGSLTALFSYAFQILMSLMMLSMVFVMIVIANASAKRIAEILEEKSDITSPENPLREVESGEIEFSNVDFCYSKTADKKVLDDINVHISSGETVGIIGGTGASKSSLVQLIPRLYDVSSGELKVGGKNVKDYDLEVLRDSVAMVLQKMFYSRAASKKTFAGEKKTQLTKNLFMLVVLLVLTNLSQPFQTDMTHILKKAAQTFLAVKNKDFALLVHFLKTKSSDFGRLNECGRHSH